MVDHNQNNLLTLKLLELIKKTGYPIVQHNGQRRTGPPPDWTGPPPQKGCEVFIGKLPRDIFEDELFNLFSTVGKIYEMRLMMDFSGSNRGYAFVTYAMRDQAAAAVKQLNGYEIKPQRYIGVVKSVDNSRLFIGKIPKNKTKEDLLEELSKYVKDIVNVIMYRHSFDRNLNRGFAFVEFKSHKAAALARRELVPGCTKLWDQEISVDWAEPEPEIDDEKMKKVKVLYARNFAIWTTPDVIKKMFEDAIAHKIERVKKIYDYAFIHFFDRKHAEVAMAKLQNAVIDGSNIEIRWSKPVDRDLYRIQKLSRGNAKFNNTSDLAQTLMLYTQHIRKKEYAKHVDYSPNVESGIGSANHGDSPCVSPFDVKPTYGLCAPPNAYSPVPVEPFMWPPTKLESICKRYMWAPPVYKYQKCLDHTTGLELWMCSVELPQVGPPLLRVPRPLGPLFSRTSHSLEQAHVEAANIALDFLNVLKLDFIQPPSQPVPPVYAQIPYGIDYSQMFPPMQPLLPLNIQSVWPTF
ncbi:probable RNA-binding protein 46 isoform X1 [Bicyclus anynana]|uniref:Probable RNA-binding protein 46 isoform X1 n=1 Tax=Bicyclus anynana TaxID=110368 RepID=A0A6J1NFR0_BICAN|nr:probable RNA-binding protein 46 isoform X1 [Bicyclus anynana]